VSYANKKGHSVCAQSDLLILAKSPGATREVNIIGVPDLSGFPANGSIGSM